MLCVIHKTGDVAIFALKIVPKNLNSHFRPYFIAEFYGIADAFLVITVDGKSYEQMVPGRVARVFAEESRDAEQSYPREESNNIFRTALLLFANQVDAATTFAQNFGGGGSAPDKDWGRDENEDDILWARRCFRKSREMVTTPVRRWNRRR